ncbi:hypothetical protein Bbelb_118720 [Branchiostoma belcheri]|nr:hypothetical protein Bbelb_118720 [Branchiostoma belcheri]
MSKAVTHSPWRLLYPSSCRSTNQHEPHDTPWGLCSLSSSYEHRCQLAGPRCVKVPIFQQQQELEYFKRGNGGPLRRAATTLHRQRRTSGVIEETVGKTGSPHRRGLEVSTKREEGASEDMTGLNRSTSKRLNRSKTLKWSTSKRLRRNT